MDAYVKNFFSNKEQNANKEQCEEKDFISKIFTKDGYIIINRNLIKTIGKDASFLISELSGEYRYYDKRNELISFDGIKKEWFYSTIENIEYNTDLSKYEQARAIKILENLGIISVIKKGQPQKRYFKIDFMKLIEVIKIKPQKRAKYIDNTQNTNQMVANSEVNAINDANSDIDNANDINNNINDFDNVNADTDTTEKANIMPKNQICQNQKSSIEKTANNISKNGKLKSEKWQIKSQNIAINNNNITNNKKINNNISYLFSSSKMQENNRQEKKRDGSLYSQFLRNIKSDTIEQEFKQTELDLYRELLINIKDILEDKRFYYFISGNKIDSISLKNKIMGFNQDHIVYMIHSLKETYTQVKNISKYILAVIWNADKTINFYYQNQANASFMNHNFDLNEYSKQYDFTDYDFENFK